MKSKSIKQVLILMAAGLLSGCAYWFDDTPPAVSDTARLTITQVTATTVTFSWNSASDDKAKTSKLSYRLYRADEPISTLDLVLAQGEAISGWYEDTTSVTLPLPISGTVYFNLLVKDLADNTAAYRGTGSIAGEYSGHPVIPIDSAGMDNFHYSLNLGSTAKEVYYLFTNAGSTGGSRPAVSSSLFQTRSPDLLSETPMNTPAPARGTAPPTSGPGAGLRDRPDLMDWQPPTPTPGSRAYMPSAPLYDVVKGPGNDGPDAVGNTGTFLIDSVTDTLAATCQKVVTVDGITLNIWVADDCWTGYVPSDGELPKTYLVTQAMVEAMADKFLKSGSDNDIYDWISGIYGAPWGPHSYPFLIPDTNAITILLFDIPPIETGYVAGYFFSKDNYIRNPDADNESSYSNERIMFYLDAPVFAQKEGSAWEVTDYYPSDQISTLAHEFQHMINFYEKTILLDSYPETWINEMCSLMAEDFVAAKIPIEGPRGVETSDPYDYSAGSYYISNLYSSSRIPEFNYWNDISLSNWHSMTRNYSQSYAFGAWLARNYGGSTLFTDIVQNSFNDERGILWALEQGDHNITMEDLLIKWGAAVLFSDQPNAIEYHRLNIGGAFPDTREYNLGSINHFNYQYTDLENYTIIGPWLYWGGSTFGGPETHEPMSNVYYLEGTNVSEPLVKYFEVAPGTRVTVVVKE